MKLLTLRNDFLEKELPGLGVQVCTASFPRGRRADPEVVKKFVATIADEKPDVFWFWKDPYLTPDILRKIKEASPKTKNLMWWGDQRGYTIPPLIGARKDLLYALFMTNDDPQERLMFQQFGIKHVPTMYHSFSTEEFQPWPIPITHDVFFGGSNFKPHKFPMSAFRTKLVYAIRREFKIVVHGGGWKFPTEPWVLRTEYAKHLRKAHLNIGVNHYDITKYYNRRLFESVACGKLHITHYIPGMEQHFENGKQLVWFTGIDQCLRHIEHFLAEPEHREKIAAQGREFFIKHHSWPQRAKQFVKKLNEIL